MYIEKIKKRVHPDANSNLNRGQIVAWYFLITYPFFLFTISAGVALLVYFIDSDNKSISLSNIGFGMLIALSSICFSYYKILDSKTYKKIHLDVQKSGELFLASAIAFVMSSALKYAWTVMPPNGFLAHWFGFLIQTAFQITFLTAEGFALLV